MRLPDKMTQVKICGVTNLEDAWVAAKAGADLLGFIFYEPSPRYVTPETVKRIVSSLKIQMTETVDQARPKFVGVFVNASLETIDQILNFCQLDAAQLHGEETPEFVNHFQGRAFKAIRPQSQAVLETLIRQYQPILMVSQAYLPALLLDAYHPTLYGGTGHVTDWTLAVNIAWQYPLMLAGSLTPTNVVEAIRIVQPWGVDVSSGVEAEKGRKDHQKVRAFIRAVKSQSVNEI